MARRLLEHKGEVSLAVWVLHARYDARVVSHLEEMMHIPGSTNPLIFAAGVLFIGGALYAFWQKDPRIGIMSLGLALANISLGW